MEMDTPVVLSILVAIAVLAFGLGSYLSKSLRLPDIGWKITLIVASVGIAILILVTSWPPKQGIDLKGGVILIYEVDEALTKQTARRRQESQGDAPVTEDELGSVDMPGLIQALSRRINPGGVQEIVVRAYGDKQVEIIIPDVTGPEVENIKKLITTGGFLKFQIVANRRDHSDVMQLADEPEQAGQYEVRNAQGEVVGQWAKLSMVPGTEGDETPEYRVQPPPTAKTRTVRGRREVLMAVDPNFKLQGSHLASVRKGFQDLSPAVFFDTTVTGAAIMGGLTESNLPDPTSGFYAQLGIVMDGELISSPRINSTITSSGIIEGQFTEEEVDLLVSVLRAGRLPAVLHPDPISQNEVSPLLGEDTIKQGKLSITISLVMVLVFMLVYYRFAGFVSCVALVLNLIFILALMIFVGAAFSLPGMAALVLTVGMSVDANVLIFERIREEMRNGAALRMSIRNGFARATRTIVDANLTTLITAVVLYLIGTEQLRAFAVALILGILMTMFTAIFCARVIFEIVERAGRLRKLTMMKWFTEVQWDLFQKRSAAAVLSITLIVIGLVAVGIRKSRIFDIDFLGGTSVQILLNDPMPIAEVRQRTDALRDAGIAQDVSITEVKSETHGDNRIYRIDTSLPAKKEAANDAESDADSPTSQASISRIQEALAEEFRDDQGNLLLATRTLTFTDPVALADGGAANDALPAIDGAAAPGSSDGAFSNSAAETLLVSAQETLLAQADEVDSGEVSEATEATDDAGAAEAEDTTESVEAVSVTEETDVTPTPDVTTPEMPTDLLSDPAGLAGGAAFDAATLRSQSQLTFGEVINATTIIDLVKETAQELGAVEPDIVVDNPEWDQRSSKGFKTWTIKLSSSPDQAKSILTALKEKLDRSPVWMSASLIGSSVAGDKTRLAIAAVVGSLFGIIAYIWIRFQHVTYGLAAVVALVHDVLITLGAIAISYWLKDVFGFLLIDEFKISLPVVAAFLTIIGYSLNDTIVVFDRIREVKGKSPHLNAGIINRSINQTLSRTLLTSLTTLLVVVILYVLGGQGVHAFAFALLIGVIVGTYSSIFVASPVLLLMSKLGGVPESQPQKVTA